MKYVIRLFFYLIKSAFFAKIVQAGSISAGPQKSISEGWSGFGSEWICSWSQSYLNIIIRCNIAGKLKITDLTSHLRSPRNYPSKTVIQPLIAASIPCQRKRPSSISPVSVRPPAPGSPLPSASTPKARTPGRSSRRKKCVPRWSPRAFAGKVWHAHTPMGWVIYRSIAR